jgi:hypothetical protein
MASAPLVPQAFWFRTALVCPRIEELPRPGSKGRLLDLPAECALPAFARLEGREPWAELRTAWNPRGLAVAAEITGKSGPIGASPEDPAYSDGVQVWIDTRDTRDVHRATKFCHRFAAVLGTGREKGPLKVEVAQRSIHRSLAESPKAPSGAVLCRAEETRKGWRLELFFTAEALHGFDPDTNRRLGFMTQVTDPGRGDEFLVLGRDFPIGEDPSLWVTLELRDGG